MGVTDKADKANGGGPVQPDPQALVQAERGAVHNRTVQVVREGGREVVRFDARPGDGLAWWQDVSFGTGTIEFSVRGKNVLQQSFVGVAFHGEQTGDEPIYEAVYFRPFNFLAEDPVRRRHMVQYICHPEFPWYRLREERPDQFEGPVQPVPDPEAWFAARVVVADRTVSVYVADSTTPSLVVERLSDRRDGWVGYWVGNGSDGDFAGLTLHTGLASDPRT